MSPSDPPNCLVIGKTEFTEEGVDFALRADSRKLKPSWSGNVIIEASVERVPPATAKGKNGAAKRRYRSVCCRPGQSRSWPGKSPVGRCNPEILPSR
jgi:hypothetical protein